MLEDLRDRLAGLFGGNERSLGFEPDETLAAVLQEVHEALGPGLTLQMVDAALKEGDPSTLMI